MKTQVMNSHFRFKHFRFTLMVAILAMSFMLAYDAAAGSNFLINPGGETRNLTGWTATHPAETYPIPGIYSSGNRVVSPHTGDRFFMLRGPKNTGRIQLEQTVDVSGYATQIDAGQVTMTAQTWVFPYDNRDSVYLDVETLTGSNQQTKWYGSLKKKSSDKAWQTLTHEDTIPTGTRKIRVILVGLISGTSGILDGYFDDVSLTLTVQELEVNDVSLPKSVVSGETKTGAGSSSMNFGNLYTYVSPNESAKTYNHDPARTKTFKIKNPGSGSTSLKWSITPPAGVTVSSTSGDLAAGAHENVTVKVNPTSNGTYSTTIPITTNIGASWNISVAATAYGTPTVKQAAPALGSNGKVNMGVNESLTFEIESDAPLHPTATVEIGIKGYQWQAQLAGVSPDSNGWGGSNTDKTHSFSFADANSRVVYGRMLDINDVGTIPVAIQVEVEDLPVVSATGGGSGWSNSSGKYVGVERKPITLQATSDLLPTTTPMTGKIGTGAGVFNGSSDYVSISNPLQSDNTSFTITLWVNPRTINSGYRGFIGWQGNTRLPSLWIAPSNGGLHYDSYEGTTRYNGILDGFFTQANEWVHVAWIKDGTQYKFYRNGVLFGTPQTAPVTFYNSSQDYWIGRVDNFFDGNLDDVGIFSRALTDTQVGALFNSALTGREDGLVYFNTFDFDGKDSHKVSRYLWYDRDPGTPNAVLLATQLPGQTTTITSNAQNLSGSLSCVAVTNHGIKSDTQSFDLKVYPTLTAQAGGPYVGRPNDPVELFGSVNTSGYPSSTFSYLWKMDGNGDGDFADAGETLTASSDPDATFTWKADGTYDVELTVTATTPESFTETATDISTVIVEAGVPTALPGGPYRGGIAGGNFSPIQLLGNPPDFIENVDVGLIDTWLWSGGPRESGLTLDGDGDYVSVGNLPITDTITVMAWIQPSAVAGLHAVAAQNGSYSFRVHGGNLVFTTPGIRDHYSSTYANIVVGQWQHVAAVFTANGTLDFYLGGRLIGTVNASAMKSSANPTLIGNNQWNQFFNGSIDDVVIFDAALSQTEIQAIMGNSPVGNEAGLLGYWGFEEGGGTTTADLSGNGNNGTLAGDSQFFVTNAENGIYNPTRSYPVAGEYGIGLRVRSTAGKWSPLATTDVTIIDGKIEGRVRAADLRTPVKEVTIKLTSSHVDINALARVATDANVSTTGDGGLSILTDAEGRYSLSKLPLGSYTLVASKGVGDDAHEFETREQLTELTLDAPNQLAIDYTDLSVFPIGGQVYYSILKNSKKVLVEGVRVTAQPVGSTSPITALASTKSLTNNQNYSLPLFAGKYLFDATRSGHDIRLTGTTPGTGTAVGTPHTNYNATSGLVTIEGALTDLDFVDYTTRTITVIVEDSGGNPIEKNADNNTIQVDVTGTNGAQTGPVVDTGQTTFTAIVPPGKYTISLPNVPTAIVKGDGSKEVAEVDVTGDDGSVTMVVPVKIQIAIGPNPTLFGIGADFLSDIGLTDADNPENYMYYYRPQPQTHTYGITATANGNRVADFTIEIVDNISQITNSIAPAVTYKAQSGRYGTTGSGNSFVGQYTVAAGIPNATVVDKSLLATFVIDADSGAEVPRVLPKTITFKASKDGYEVSDVTTLSVTVLGDLADGNFSELVSVPNVNYIVLHDPPGDDSYSYLDDTMTIKGILDGVTMRAKDGTEIPVHPSPWSTERSFGDAGDWQITSDSKDLSDITTSDKDIGTKGLLGYRDPDGVAGAFTGAAFIEAAVGGITVATGPLGYAIQLYKLPVTGVALSNELVQYEVSAGRKLATPVEDEIDDVPDKMGPGKGDLYYGEGWTLGLQTKHRLGIKSDGQGGWTADTALILTYDIVDRNNQYVYNVPDIERIIVELNKQQLELGTPTEGSEDDTKQKKLIAARDTWIKLLEKNPAYVWRKKYIDGKKMFSEEIDKTTYGDESSGLTADRATLETFMKQKFPGKTSELLLFTGDSEFEYSRTSNELNVVEFESEISVSTESTLSHEFTAKTGFDLWGNGAFIKLTTGSETSIGTAQTFSKTRESGTESEQTVGFVLGDGDTWDSFAAYTYEGPWGTPIFFTDPGSVSSWPWQAGTEKGVDLQFQLLSTEDNGPFDYRDGAHYQFQITSTGRGVKEGSGLPFIFYDLPTGNTKSATVKFNGSDEAPYTLELFKGLSAAELFTGIEEKDGIGIASAKIMVSIYPPQSDWDNTASVEYPVVVQAESAKDYQIVDNKILRPRFADLRAPSATITAPYDGQRISPTLFTSAGFKIDVFCDDEDVAKIQLQKRTKQPDGVFEPWQNLSGVVWEDGKTNANVAVVTHTSRDPQRREFTFTWAASAITTLGVGEYQLRAVAQDAATQLNTAGTAQVAAINVDLDAPVVTFRVDSSPPSVLTTVPFYQDSESQRIYHGELSASFTDDMTADDFSDRTFYVVDLLNSSAKVAGFVSYSPTLRKAIFVPVTPLVPNGFYKATMKTDTFDGNNKLTESGVHDLAGNALDLEFSWTFRTTDTPFEETWSIELSATDGSSTDTGKIASVAFGALDGEDEKDARAVPRMSSQISLKFIHNGSAAEFDRDTRPADGRLGHHWFLVVDDATVDATVQIKWLPSLKLARATRQYQVINLVEFTSVGSVIQTISLNPTNIDPDGDPVLAYSYTATDNSQYFRLDVMKANIVATTLVAGSSGWNFFSAPITPQRADPFVNLGDDIDPFQMFQYSASESTYKVYPFDLGAVSLQTGHGYFTRLTQDVEVDVGGSSNNSDITMTLDVAGWHAIGNPFIKGVIVDDLKFGQAGDILFSTAVDTKIEGTLYRWELNASGGGQGGQDRYTDVITGGTLIPWEGYFIRTLVDNVTLTIPAPSGLATWPATLPPSFDPPILAPPAVREPEAGEFELRFALTSDSSADLITVLGTRKQASAGHDSFDRSEPPRLQGTVSLYFEHKDWDARGGVYNRDIKTVLKVGKTANWTVIAFTDAPNAKMRLAWEDAIGSIPDDILLEFRESDGEGVWRDMRSEKFVQIESYARRTKVSYEIRATRFALEPISDLSVVAGEAEVKLQWNASENPYITDYTIYRDSEALYELSSTRHSFIDTDVEEEATYAYQVGVRFRTGAELKSKPFTVTVLPVIKATVLWQNYPNPFNPETWIPYELAEDAKVSIHIYGINGQLVRTLDLGFQPRSRYVSKEKAAYWDGRNEWGEQIASGIYFYLLRAGKNFSATRKLVILK